MRLGGSNNSLLLHVFFLISSMQWESKLHVLWHFKKSLEINKMKQHSEQGVIWVMLIDTDYEHHFEINLWAPTTKPLQTSYKLFPPIAPEIFIGDPAHILTIFCSTPWKKIRFLDEKCVLRYRVDSSKSKQILKSLMQRVHCSHTIQRFCIQTQKSLTTKKPQQLLPVLLKQLNFFWSMKIIDANVNRILSKELWNAMMMSTTFYKL